MQNISSTEPKQTKSYPRWTTASKKITRLKKRLKIIQGGTSAGKTYAILQILIFMCMVRKVEVSVVSESIPHLRRGALKDFLKLMILCGVYEDKRFNKSTLTYTFDNGSFMEFFSADQPDKVRGARRDILFINECNNISYETFNQLEVRTRLFCYLDYNPTGEFWVQTEIINQNFEYDFIILTYKDNEELTKDIIESIERRKNNVYWWSVYGLGQQGRLEGAIFDNWHEGAFDTSLPYTHGMDFGFFPDPTTLVKTAVDNKMKRIYLQQKFYLQKLSYDDIKTLLRANTLKDDLIVADSQEKRVINDLIGDGFNVNPCIKYPGCVLDRIRKFQDYTLIVTPDSYELKKELMNYRWLDKKSSTPIDDFDHAIQAAQYGADERINDTGFIFK